MHETIDEQKRSQQIIQGNRERPFGILVKTESKRTMLSGFIMNASIKHIQWLIQWAKRVIIRVPIFTLSCVYLEFSHLTSCL